MLLRSLRYLWPALLFAVGAFALLRLWRLLKDQWAARREQPERRLGSGLGGCVMDMTTAVLGLFEALPEAREARRARFQQASFACLRSQMALRERKRLLPAPLYEQLAMLHDHCLRQVTAFGNDLLTDDPPEVLQAALAELEQHEQIAAVNRTIEAEGARLLAELKALEQALSGSD